MTYEQRKALKLAISEKRKEGLPKTSNGHVLVKADRR